MGYLRRVWHAERGHSLRQTPDSVPLGTCICFSCWDQSFSNTFYRTMHFEQYFLNFHMTCHNVNSVVHIFLTAVYLCKRTMQNKQRLELADYEAENLARLQKMFSRKWEFIFMQAEAQAKYVNINNRQSINISSLHCHLIFFSENQKF